MGFHILKATLESRLEGGGNYGNLFWEPAFRANHENY